MEDYDELLNNAFKKVNIHTKKSDRFVLPAAKVFMIIYMIISCHNGNMIFIKRI